MESQPLTITRSPACGGGLGEGGATQEIPDAAAKMESNKRAWTLRSATPRLRYGVRELAPAFTCGSLLPQQEECLLQGKAAASRRVP